MSDFTSNKSISAIAQHAPYSWIVCDASIDSHELLPKISSTLEKASNALMADTTIENEAILESSNQEGDDVDKAKDEAVHPLKKGKENKENNDTPNAENPNVKLTKQKTTSLLSLPAVMVITLKLPYKTAASLERNLKRVLSKVPHELQKIASSSSSSTTTAAAAVSFHIVHLMANSDSERTIVAVFDEEKGHGGERHMEAGKKE
eukprot:1421133-Ditylum_brightwellii.AAC.1